MVTCEVKVNNVFIGQIVITNTGASQKGEYVYNVDWYEAGSGKVKKGTFMHKRSDKITVLIKKAMEVIK